MKNDCKVQTSNSLRPTVSVGMPVFNGERWIAQSIDSILGQTFRDFELIISDNASTDGTEAICRSYASKDNRVRYYRNEKNRGAIANYNAVFGYALGQYFKWASSNDYCAPEFLERCVGVLEHRHDVVLCYPRCRLFESAINEAVNYDDNLDLQDDDAPTRFKRLLANIRLDNVMNGVIRADVLGRTKLIGAHYSADSNMLAELALQGKFVEVPEYLFYRRMDRHASTKLKSAEEVLAHHDPALRRELLFPHWRVIIGYYSAVRRAPLILSDKARLYYCLSRWAFWGRRQLSRDIFEAFGRLLHYRGVRVATGKSIKQGKSWFMEKK